MKIIPKRSRQLQFLHNQENHDPNQNIGNKTKTHTCNSNSNITNKHRKTCVLNSLLYQYLLFQLYPSAKQDLSLNQRVQNIFVINII